MSFPPPTPRQMVVAVEGDSFIVDSTSWWGGDSPLPSPSFFVFSICFLSKKKARVINWCIVTLSPFLATVARQNSTPFLTLDQKIVCSLWHTTVMRSLLPSFLLGHDVEITPLPALIIIGVMCKHNIDGSGSKSHVDQFGITYYGYPVIMLPQSFKSRPICSPKHRTSHHYC